MQGCRSLLFCGQAIRKNKKIGYIVKVVFFSYCAKHNHMLMLAPRKILKNRCSEIELGGISGSMYTLYNIKSES